MVKVNGSSIAVPVSPPMPGTMPEHQAHDAAEPEKHQAVRLHQGDKGLARRGGHEGDFPREALHHARPAEIRRVPHALSSRRPGSLETELSEGCRSGRPFPCWRRLKKKIAGCGSGLAAAWASRIFTVTLRRSARSLRARGLEGRRPRADHPSRLDACRRRLSGDTARRCARAPQDDGRCNRWCRR